MEIKFDKKNYRKHSDKNKALIKKSLEECGAGRSIVIDNKGEIIAGNGIYEQAQKLGIKTKIIETDGSELVVVKRTDLDTHDDKRRQLAVMDNKTSDTSYFDTEVLLQDFDIEELQSFGFDENELISGGLMDELEEGVFTDKFSKDVDIFCVSFSFPKEKEEAFLQKLKLIGKDVIANKILQFMEV